MAPAAPATRVQNYRQRSGAEVKELSQKADEIWDAAWQYYLNTEGWAVSKRGADGAIVYVKKDSKGKSVFKLNGQIELDQDLFVRKFFGIEEAEDIPRWNTTMSLVQKLQDLDTETHIMYQVTTPIGPGGLVSSRDVTLVRRCSKSQSGNGKFVLCYGSVKLDDVPAVKNTVRAECFPSLAVVETVKPGVLELTWVIDMDLKLSYVPTAILNQAFQYLLLDNFKCIRERSQRLRDGTEH